MTTVSGTFTAIGVSATLSVSAAGENIAWSVSGTFDQTVQLERALTPAETAWEVVAGPFNSVAASGVYSSRAEDRLRWRSIRQGGTPGTVTYSVADEDKLLDTVKAADGSVAAQVFQSGTLRYGTRYGIQPVPASKTTTTTLTAAELLTGIISANQGAAGAATYTLPTGANMLAALPADFPVLGSFDFSVVNVSTNAAEDVTIASGSQFTLVGSGFVASNAATTDKSAGTFRVRQSSPGSFVCYRIG